jgi:hypothetical protein
MPREKLERLEKLVISLLVQIQEIKCSQDIVNREEQNRRAGDHAPVELFTETSHLSEDFLELIFMKSGGDGVNFC